MPVSKAAKNKQRPLYSRIEPYALGGFSGMFATCCIQPIDMVKVRIQLLGEGGSQFASKNPFAVARQAMGTDGFFSLYRGLSAALLRQATYTTARLGLFAQFSDALRDENGGLTFGKRVVASLSAGGLASIFGTPADVALVRMQADGTLPPEQRRGYKNVGDALIKIIRNEGFMGMFTGVAPVIVRAASLNVGMLATNDQAMETARKYTDNQLAVRGIAKVLSGFFAAFLSLPFDFLKTRLQKQKPGPDGTLPYKNLMDCGMKVFTQEGPMTFYRGFWTYYVRIAPHAMITLVVLEALRDMSDVHVWKKEEE